MDDIPHENTPLECNTDVTDEENLNDKERVAIWKRDRLKRRREAAEVSEILTLKESSVVVDPEPVVEVIEDGDSKSLMLPIPPAGAASGTQSVNSHISGRDSGGEKKSAANSVSVKSVTESEDQAQNYESSDSSSDESQKRSLSWASTPSSVVAY